MKSRSFSTLEIGKALGIQRERLRDWMNRGFIKPTVSATGQGSKAGFTLSDVYGVAFFGRLVASGLSREVAASYVQEFLKREKDQPDDQKTVRIVFKIRDERTLSVMTFARVKGKWKMDLETGWAETEGMETSSQQLIEKRFPNGWLDKDWQMIHIVNFEALREKVDTALAKL
jgi:hypothetical protein